jgi:hypothetical protein
MSNSKLKLYPNERKAIRIIARLQDRGRYEFTLEEFAARLFVKRARKEFWRNNTAQLLRRLSGKLVVTRCRLERTSGLGRSALARYKASGFFNALVTNEKGEEA